MPGIQIQHPSMRNAVLTLIHEGRPLRWPMLCGMCSTPDQPGRPGSGQAVTHIFKTYHVRFDGAGNSVVSEEVFRRLEEAGLGELRAKREIRKPEPMVIDLGRGPESFTVISREAGVVRAG